MPLRAYQLRLNLSLCAHNTPHHINRSLSHPPLTQVAGPLQSPPRLMLAPISDNRDGPHSQHQLPIKFRRSFRDQGPVNNGENKLHNVIHASLKHHNTYLYPRIRTNAAAQQQEMSVTEAFGNCATAARSLPNTHRGMGSHPGEPMSVSEAFNFAA